jgi:hypothetical protein
MHFPVPISFKTHLSTTFLATKWLYSTARVSPVDQYPHSFSHQFTALFPTLCFQLPKARFACSSYHLSSSSYICPAFSINAARRRSRDSVRIILISQYVDFLLPVYPFFSSPSTDSFALHRTPARDQGGGERRCILVSRKPEIGERPRLIRAL